MVVSAVFAPFVTPYEPNKPNFSDILATPSKAHWFGTDALGRDLFSRIAYGARPSLLVGVGSAALATLLGALIGVIGGYLGGRTDALLMRLMDILFAFPAILLALALVVVLGPDVRNVIIALAIIYVPRFARITRSATLALRSEAFIEAARALGGGRVRLISLYILPNIMSPIIVQATITIAFAILSEASLSFLGMGIQPPQPSWGAMLSEGRTYLEQYPHLTIFPGVAIMLAVLGFNLLGDGLRDILDPQS